LDGDRHLTLLALGQKTATATLSTTMTPATTKQQHCEISLETQETSWESENLIYYHSEALLATAFLMLCNDPVLIVKCDRSSSIKIVSS